MTKEISMERTKWLKILIGIFSAWVTFMLSMIILFAIILVIQIQLFDIEIEDTPAIILLLFVSVISVYVAFKITKWQNRFLDKRSLNINYIVLAILIILSILTLPAAMTYTLF